MKEKINPLTPGLIIRPDGGIEAMRENEENHAPFFQRIIKSEYQKLGMPCDNIEVEDNLVVLMKLLINEFQILPYQGCTSGDRRYSDGYLFIPELDKLTDEQLPAIINLYTSISAEYTMHITKTNFQQFDETEISLGEIYEEMLNRSTGKHR